MRILAGDIGGTKTRLALFEEGQTTPLRKEIYESRAHKTLDEVVQLFLGDERIDVASFGVAGPVVEDAVRATNLPWHVDAMLLAKFLDVPRVHVLNDFHAIALGVPLLTPNELHCLNDVPRDPAGVSVIAGAGTGLGEAILVPSVNGISVLASEGGHTDFAPRNEDEFALLSFLTKRHERVSVERVVSGMGLAAIFEFLTATGRANTEARTLERMHAEDKGAVIGELALAKSDEACVRTVEIFLSLYGSELGNLALKVLAPGGAYVAGGIAPRLLSLFAESEFMSSFFAKGRMRPLLENTRVDVILRTDVGLLGAMNRAIIG